MPLFQGKWHRWTLHESSIWNYSGRLWSYRVVHFVSQTSMIYFEITNIFQGLKVTPSSGSQLVTYRYPHGPIMESYATKTVSVSMACRVVWMIWAGQAWGPPRLRADGTGISVMPQGL